MGFSWAMNSLAAWKDHELQHHENPSLYYMAFSMSMKTKQEFSWCFHEYFMDLRKT